MKPSTIRTHDKWIRPKGYDWTIGVEKIDRTHCTFTAYWRCPSIEECMASLKNIDELCSAKSFTSGFESCKCIIKRVDIIFDNRDLRNKIHKRIMGYDMKYERIKE